MKKSQYFFGVMGIVLIAYTASAISGESKLDLVYEAPIANSKNQPEAEQQKMVSCPIYVSLPIDSRKNKETLGTTFRDNPITSSKPIDSWLRTALLTLSKQGFTVQSYDNPEQKMTESAIIVKVELEKLYLWNHSMNLQSTISGNLILQKNNKEVLPQTNYFHLVGTKLNWANTDGEFVSTLNIAADRLVQRVAKDVRTLCNG